MDERAGSSERGNAPAASESEKGRPRQVLGLRDVVLFFVALVVNLQWVATASQVGPSAIVVWLIGALLMFLPLAYCVIALSSRFPQEGGMYVWSKRAFGDFAGFITGWTYFTSNLPFFPAVLYFAASNALYIGGSAWRGLSSSAAYFVVASVLALAICTWLHVIGLGVGRWLTNAGAVARWIATGLLIAIGAIALVRSGSATEFTVASILPGIHLKDMIFWTTIAYAFTGFEQAPLMGGEICDSARTIPRAVYIAVPLIALIYIVGTISVLVALPASDATRLEGIMQAIQAASDRIGVPAITPAAAAVLTISVLGGVGASLAAVARIPFVAGIDHYLPESFARIHPRYGTPYVAILAQSLIAVLFIFLGQAGTSVKGAYDVLVSMTIIATFIPFLFLFAAAIKLRREPPAPGTFQPPGGGAALAILAVVGFITTAFSILVSVLPPEDEPSKIVAVTKIVGLSVVLVGSGAVVYALGRRRAARLARPLGSPVAAPEPTQGSD